MKLFQRLLIAPAALGLVAPLAANADLATPSVEVEEINAGDHHDPNTIELFCEMHPDEP